MEGINWDMLKAIAGVVSFVMCCIGGLILASAKSIFITKKEFEKKLYSEDGLPIFESCDDCGKKHGDLNNKLEKLIDRFSEEVVPRKEFNKTNEFRERRFDTTQREVCDRLNDVTDTMRGLQKTQNETNIIIGKLSGMLALRITDEDRIKNI